ncbi:MAG: HD domain-containing protein [Armatimonadetes bacterium]|nr:HD domain-containing protein [Armatimonadota bacterium]
MAGKLIRDAVHGDIRFDAIEMAVVDTPPVQRLRGIKQLGASHLVYPSAVHTRFEHSLGTAWLAKRLMAELAERGTPLPAEDAVAVPLAALLHDVTHVPFGHTFEDERRLFDRHDEDESRLDFFLSESTLASALAQSGVGARVRELLTSRQGVAAEIVSGTVCADLLDYLRRDAHGTGLPQVYDDRIYRAFTVLDGHLAVDLQKQGLLRHDVLSELIHLLRVRYNLTERVYYHHAKTVAGAMISKALELALDAGCMARADLYGLGDESFLWLLRQRLAGEPQAVGLLDELAARRLYKRVYQTSLRGLSEHGIDAAQQARLAAVYHYDPAARRAAEEQLASALGLAPSEVLIYCPSPRMQLKEAAVPVCLRPGEVTGLDQLNNAEVASLSAKYRTLWRLLVCLRRDREGSFKRAGHLAEELFGAPNLLTLSQSGGLAFDRS